ncbi:MAG: hypothetical protein C9356_12720 [Oleiphilus sp.]|nr:MAG: hypothetical protein C9356_12720 [Oleiphilus sp.]
MTKSLKWNKIGKVFDPTQYGLINGCKEFAQSPQALEFNDFVRVYFSTRARDPENGKFLSHIAYVDMSKDFREILKVSNTSVIDLGVLGTFDEHGIFPINVMRHDDRILAYTCGWSRRSSTSVETGIGFAESFDSGATFEKLGSGPIVGASLNEPFLVGDAFVRYFEGKFHMWYMFGIKWAVMEEEAAPDRVYKIGHATSMNGIDWKKEEGLQVVPDKLHENESMALPTVEFFDGRYHMFFCYRESSDFRNNSARGYRLGYAYSYDLKSWVRNDKLGGAVVSKTGWDSEMQCYPHLLKMGGDLFLLYNGNEFGRFGFGVLKLVRNSFDRIQN